MTGLLPIDHDFDDGIDYDESVFTARTWIFVDLSLPAAHFLFFSENFCHLQISAFLVVVVVVHLLVAAVLVLYLVVLVLVVVLWRFGPFSGHGFPVTAVSRQSSTFEVRMSFPRPTPNLEAQSISFRLSLVAVQGSTLPSAYSFWPVGVKGRELCAICM